MVVAHDQGFPTQLANQTMLYIQVYRGNHTAAVTSDSAAFRNTLLVIIIVVVTFVLSIVVIVTMVLIRHQDRQRRLYRAKDEEVKVGHVVWLCMSVLTMMRDFFFFKSFPVLTTDCEYVLEG